MDTKNNAWLLPLVYERVWHVYDTATFCQKGRRVINDQIFWPPPMKAGGLSRVIYVSNSTVKIGFWPSHRVLDRRVQKKASACLGHETLTGKGLWNCAGDWIFLLTQPARSAKSLRLTVTQEVAGSSPVNPAIYQRFPSGITKYGEPWSVRSSASGPAKNQSCPIKYAL